MPVRLRFFSSRQLAAFFRAWWNCFDQSAAAALTPAPRAILAKTQPIGRYPDVFIFPKRSLLRAGRAGDLAHGVGTPAYVYSSQAILANYREYDEAFADFRTRLLPVKANSSLAVLGLLAKRSGLRHRVRRIIPRAPGGGTRRRCSSPSGARRGRGGIRAGQRDSRFNSESESELALIDSLAARRGVKAALDRVNPDVDAPPSV